MFIIVCYTNIDDAQLAAVLESDFKALKDFVRWTIDLDDSDKVLRVLARRDITLQVCEVVQRQGYTCLPMGVMACY